MHSLLQNPNRMSEVNHATITRIYRQIELTCIPIPKCLEAVLGEFTTIFNNQDANFCHFVLCSKSGQKMLMTVVVLESLIAGRIEQIIFKKLGNNSFGCIKVTGNEVAIHVCGDDHDYPVEREKTDLKTLDFGKALALWEKYFSGAKMSVACYFPSINVKNTQNNDPRELIDLFMGWMTPETLNLEKRQYLTCKQLAIHIQGMPNDQRNKIINKSMSLILQDF